MKTPTYFLLLGLLLIKAAVAIVMIITYGVHLSPDEAQYWTWSRVLDWGYYSKPPAIAWQIGLTTSLFGDTELGVRIGAVLIAFLLPLAVYHLALSVGLKQKSCFWAAIAMAFSPLGIYLTFAATTDGGAILCLTLALSAIVKQPNYPLAGFWIFLGALYKWIAFLFWPLVLLFSLFFPEMRRKNLIWGMLFSFLALFPSIYWNMSHEWATFKHVGSAVGQSSGGNFLDFLGAQVGLISPIFFCLLLIGYRYLWKSANHSLTLCALFPTFVLAYLSLALFKKVQPNWAAYLYPPAMVLIGWVGYEKLQSGRVWLPIGTALSILCTSGAIVIPAIQSHNLFSKFHIPYKVNPFRHSMGWDQLQPILEASGYRSDKDFLFGDKYQTASLLSFYGPEKKQAYFFNISETRKNQFSYWPSMQERELGKTGFFVVLEHAKADSLSWYENHYLERLSPYFEEVEWVGSYPLFLAYGEAVKYGVVFKCRNYQGEGPIDPEKY
ncbi:MAG: glycosyltransferase family 39 protein [Chlamydiales bacterium]